MDTLPLVTPEQVGLSAARLDRVRTWMNGWVDSGKLAGMVACVMRKGELAFAEVVGKSDLARNKPMRADTIFRIYSMTKPLTSVAIMMLYEEGRFQLDDPISKFIPAFANPTRHGRRQPRQDRDGAGRARDQLPRPAHPHVGPDLRLHGEQPGRCRLSRQAGRSRFPDRRHQPEAGGRAAGAAAADRPAGQGVELLGLHRRAGLPGRGDLRPALREVPEGKGHRPARHGRHRFPRPGRQARSLRRQLRRRRGRQARPDRRSGQEPLPRAAQGELGRRRPRLDRRPTICASASSC